MKQEKPWIKKIESNVKSPTGDIWNVEIGKHTLLVGSNTSHKSAVTQSLELALSAAADDIVNRNEVKDGALLMSLSPSDYLECTAVINDGTEAYYRLESEKGKVGRPKHDTEVDCSMSLPLRLVRKALAGSSTTARKSFVLWAAQNADREDVLAQIPANYHARYEDLAEHIGRNLSEIETLIAVTDYTSKSQRDSAKEVKGAEAVFDKLRGDLDERPSDTEMYHFSEEVKRLQALLVASAAGPTDPNLKRIQANKYVLDWAVEEDMSSCPSCSSEVGHSHLVACADYYGNAERGTIAQLEAESTQSSDMEAIKHQLNVAESKLSMMIAAAGKWDTVMQAKETALSMKQQVERYKEMKKICEDAVGHLVRVFGKTFSDGVSRFLPDGWDFGIELEDQGRDVFRMGLRRNDKLCCALSGAEWAAVTTAIAMQMSTPSDAPSVLIPEDRAWDGSTLSAVMRAFSKYDGQVLMASTIRPKGRSPKNWTIIDMDKWLEEQIEGKPEEEELELGQAPSEFVPRTNVTSTYAIRVLHGLGYLDEQINAMQAEAAAKIISGGHLASCTEILADGNFQVIEAGNLVPLPKATQFK